MSLFTVPFWKDTLERTIGTFVQAGIAAIGADTLGIIHVDWTQTASVAGLAALVALGKCIVAVTLDDNTGASLGTAIPAPRETGDTTHALDPDAEDTNRG